MSVLDRNEAEELCGRILAMTDADDATVSLEGGERTHLRFANNQVTTSGSDRNTTVSISVSYGSRTGTASGNQLDEDSLRAIVESAQQIARLAPEDPEHMSTLGPQTYAKVFGSATPADPEALQKGCTSILRGAEERGLVSSGLATYNDRFDAMLTSNGAYGHYRWTRADLSTTARTPDGEGSGWGNHTAPTADGLDYASTGRRAADKAERSVGRKPLEPGRYPTILEPACVANLMSLLSGALDRRRADEGRSFLKAEDLLKPRFPTWINALSNPSDPRVPTRPFSRNGLAHVPRSWIRGGQFMMLPTSRYWAQKIGTHPIPSPSNWLMTGGDGDLDKLIQSTERGVLVTSLWYIRSVDPRKLLYTGLTRDGVYWIEDGEIQHPLTNMRWNDSPIEVLANAEAASSPVLTNARKGWSGPMMVPALRTSSFHFTSVSDAV